MTDRLARLAIALAIACVVGACAQADPLTPSPAGGSTAGPGATDGADRALPLLIDTDVAPDDLVAIAFLVASPRVEIEAITVSGTGEAHCEAGVDVVLRLLERLDAPEIAVACGRETPIAGDHAFPDEWRSRVDEGSGLALPSTSRQPFAGDAVRLITETAESVDGLRVLTLGPLTNLADALAGQPLGELRLAGGSSPSTRWAAHCMSPATSRSVVRPTTRSRSGTSTSIRRPSRR